MPIDEFDEVLAAWLERLDRAQPAQPGDDDARGYVHDFTQLQRDAARFPELYELLRLSSSLRALPPLTPDPARFEASLRRIKRLRLPINPEPLDEPR